MEELVLTDPVVVPEKVTNKYRVSSLTLNLDAPNMPPEAPGLILIDVVDNHGERSSFRYVGKAATDMIKFLNTANLTTKSLHKRVLERLSADGLLPGTVTGAPDPPVE